jgi:2'-hydroxyisoflavone reductase
MPPTMDLLIIGGTRFVGRHLVDAARAAGHRVTLFNRGQTAATSPEGVECLRGDRRVDLSALSTGQWDAVIDTCGYLPGEVAAMATTLKGRVGRYVFISSVSAYATFTEPNDEGSPLGRIDDPDTEVVDGRTYGPLKALCERAVSQRFGERSLLVRPGLVVGPHDPTGRFTWWPARVAHAAAGEPVLVPGAADDPVQFIDARDLAAFVMQALASELTGPVNVASPAGQWTMGDVMQACAQAAGTSPAWCWAGSQWLLAQGVAPWNDMPLWMPASGEYAAFMRAKTGRAQAAGLVNRPLADTVADTLHWWQALPPEQQAFGQSGLAPQREAALHAAWRGA